MIKMMSRKDYRAAAAVIADQLEETREYTDRYVIHASLLGVALGLSRMFKNDNSRFSESIFMDAAGFEQRDGKWEVKIEFGGYLPTVRVINDNEPSHLVNRGAW